MTNLWGEGVLENIRLAIADAIGFGSEPQGIKWRKIRIAHIVLMAAWGRIHRIIQRDIGSDSIRHLKGDINYFVSAIVGYTDAVVQVAGRIFYNIENLKFDTTNFRFIAGFFIGHCHIETTGIHIAATVHTRIANLRDANREGTAA